MVVLGAARMHAQTDQIIYADSVQNGWENWSWSSSVDFNSTAKVHAGAKATAVTMTAGWAGFSLHHADFDSGLYTDLSFWVNGGASGGQQLLLYAELAGVAQPSVNLDPLPTNAWRQITIPLGSLGVENRPNFSRFNLQDRTGKTSAIFYLDDIKLVASSVLLPSVILTEPAAGAIFTTPASVTLAANVTTNGHAINKVQFLSGSSVLAEDTLPPYRGTWTGGAPGSYAVFARVIYDGAATRDSAPASITLASNTTFLVTINVQSNRHLISPLIYGTAFASTTELADLNFTINRSGGNSETRYNWALNAHNHAADWYYESIADSSASPAGSADEFVTSTRAGGAEPALTLPMIEWMPKLAANRGKLASYSISKYGPQTGNDSQWMPDAGNGISSSNSSPITWNDPNDANFPTNSMFQLAFLQHLTNKFGVSTNGGIHHYILDNEHSIWHSTHQDIHPNGASRREIRDKMFDYSAKVKGLDPAAQVWGPEEFGWSGYLNSGADLQYGDKHGWSYLPDRSTNGSLDYVCWLLDQFRQRELATGARWLDYFTLHRYPEGAERNNNGTDVSVATQQLRNRSTRSFWDPNYVDESWIGSPVQLIPRMKLWVATYYPGTKLGITEYNWYAEDHINGATAQADLLGIFGREGLDLATRWTTPSAATPTYKAMKMYRNYDGNKSTFGDLSVSATGNNPDLLSAFAAVRTADGALTVIAINKQLGSAAVTTLNLSNFLSSGTAQIWQLTSANVINHLADLSLSGSALTATLPPQSITLFVVPAGSAPAPTLHAAMGEGQAGSGIILSFASSAGQKYQLQRSSALWPVAWNPVGLVTNGTGNEIRLSDSISGATQQYYRVVLQP